MNSRDKGNRGEDAAAAYLESAGYRVIKRNHYIRGGEVDIIFADGGRVVFCEVKARSSGRFGTPAEAVTLSKRKRICKAALDYASKNNNIDEIYRFDIIEVDNGRINHIKDAFGFIEP